MMILGTHKVWDDSSLSEVLSNGRNMASMGNVHVNAWSVHSVVYLVLWKICSTSSLWLFGFEYAHGWLDGWKITCSRILECTVPHPHCVLRDAFVSYFQPDTQAVHRVPLHRKGYSGYICFMSIGLSGEYGVETCGSIYVECSCFTHVFNRGQMMSSLSPKSIRN